MFTTGDACQTSGIYNPNCDHKANSIVVAQGERLPICARCSAPVTWTRTYPPMEEVTGDPRPAVRNEVVNASRPPPSMPPASGTNGTSKAPGAGTSAGATRSHFTATRSAGAETGSVSYVHRLSTTPTWVQAFMQSGGPGRGCSSTGEWNASKGMSNCVYFEATSGAGMGNALIMHGDSSGRQIAIVSRVDSTDVTLDWIKLGEPDGATLQLLVICGT